LLSPRVWCAVELLTIGAALAAGNLWFTAARSTIPLGIDGTVMGKEVRREKHPPHDSVFLLKLDGGYLVHVDAPVYEAVQTGERIAKTDWSRELKHGSQTLTLGWSPDFHGMRWAMPVVILIMLAAAGCSVIQSAPKGQS
jgi:hypothetical protein